MSLVRTPNLVNPQSRTIAPSTFRVVNTDRFRWATVRLSDVVAEIDREDVTSMHERMLAIRAARGLQAFVQEETARDFLKDNQFRDEHDPYSPSKMLVTFHDQIIARPGAAQALLDLFQWIENIRVREDEGRFFPDPNGQGAFSRNSAYGMADFLVAKAQARLDTYEEILRWNREQKDPEKKRRNDDPPANIYRDYGLALRYATEELGIFTARLMLAKLMLASPLPIDELEAPDWIDGYTGERDPNAEFLRVKADLSSSGNSDEADLPIMLADLLENMSPTQRDEFRSTLLRLGIEENDYWKQFLEAQRSGYNPEIGTELEDDEGAEFDVIEKDFQFQADVKVTGSDAHLRGRLKEELKELRAAMNDRITLQRAVDHYFSLVGQVKAGIKAYYAHETVDLTDWDATVYELDETLHKLRHLEAEEEDILDSLRAFLIIANCEPVTSNPKKDLWKYHKILNTHRLGVYSGWSHDWFLNDGRVRKLVKAMNNVSDDYAPQDVMAVLLPFQNGYAFEEGDLRNFAVNDPLCLDSLWCWYDVNGDEFLEQFLNKDGVDYGDPAVNKCYGGKYVKIYPPTTDELDEFSNDFVEELQRVYKEGEERRVKWMQMRDLKYKQNVRWHPAFVTAEVEAAVKGDGGTDNALAAGWEAWREAIDPEANAEFHYHINRGAERKAAMAEFFRVVKRNQNRMLTATKAGVTLRSRRVVDWGIFRMKVQKGETFLERAEAERLLRFVIGNKYATQPFIAWLKSYIAQ